MSVYRPHDHLIAPARASAALWRLGLGVVLIVVAFFTLNVIWYGFLRDMPDAAALFTEIAVGNTARGMALLLGSFACLIVALMIALQVVHRRSLVSLVGPMHAFAVQSWRVFRACLLLYVVIYLIPMPAALAPEQAMPLGRWLTLVPLTLALLILQCGAEELVFRGYLQSQLAARFRAPWIWMGLPSLLFGALHYEPAVYGDVAIWLALWSGLFGLAAADLTARSGTLGPAIALHVVNNFSAMGLTAMHGHWDGLALYTLPITPEDTDALMQLMPLEGAILICAWLAARIAVRR
ncbi:CPBP family intramembrane glutamic endopeptidase [Shimia sp.]|uniref:CPBP family intramembrane glutamic endopeptidase n=1 Tax=Shimia sp. TaxID=1954381 RepID=UPI0032981CEE